MQRDTGFLGVAQSKLKFQIATTSGEDPDHPARELLLHTTHGRGWQSPRFCAYPQEIEFRLDSPSRLTSIQILCHEYKIPQLVTIFISTIPASSADLGQAVEQRLGHIRMDDNQRSSHQARELKTIQLDHNAVVFVRLVLDRCHVNEHNIYNQVGVVAVNFTGTPLYGGPWSYDASQRYLSAAPSDACDLQLEIQVDPKTAERIYELNRLKHAAVEQEDYDEAKRLKDSIARLKQVGQKLAQLEAQKQMAVEREDYELAKQIKKDADRLRATGEATAGAPLQHVARSGPQPEEIFSRVLQPSVSHVSPAAGSKLGAPDEQHIGPDQNTTDNIPVRGLEGSFADVATMPGAFAQDEHSLQAEEAASVRATEREESSETAQEDQRLDPPTGFNDVLDGQALACPLPLNSANANDADVLLELFGEYVARCAYAPSWQHRQAAMRFISTQVEAGKVSETRHLVKFLVKGLRDKVAAVVVDTSKLMLQLVNKKGKAAPHIMQAAFPVLVERLGDGNARVAEVMKQNIVGLAKAMPADTATLVPQMLRPPRNAALWKPQLARLEVLATLVPDLHVGRDRGALPTSEVMSFLGSAAGNPKSSVRAAAVRVIGLVVKEAGPSEVKLLPLDLNPKVMEQIADSVGMDMRTLQGAEAQASSGSPTLAVPARGKPKSARSAKSPAPTAARRGSESPDRQESPVAEDHHLSDVAEFERDLAQKEARYGKDHPLVADCLSNMAIIYNQRGEQEKALPMYERALAIFEKSKGADSQDVAHTLTDMAVLHLEAHRDDIGRPLLERALQIQRTRLGPDHPDVTAILDVLNGD
eukprot:jgi/Ulvmu1/4308/UM002_0029.1